MSKKVKIGAVLVTVLGALYASYNPVDTAHAKLVGESLQQCQASCVQPCFCNRSCLLTWCFGPWYCQCCP